ncbi:hypothetical protein EX895_004512 [Sporisorium graminicola]|uniref:Uncharacterized protein n=1 Tax=Sporisorium graminicola TaxID=280036 RepID=A0A4U7KQ25_9BASI|nr:hypothetical protein EX895_004512 [Sporisorium graminicola]TKY86363.1 hypothetical protein EX895_004512 [Sporisorium graminicola]
MDSIPGDQWIGEYARWLRVHEAKLGDLAASTTAAKRNAAAAKIGRDAPPSTLSSTFWNVVTLGTAASAPANGSASLTARPMLLRQNPHNLYYLLIRFEALGLPVGSLDIKVPGAARPTSYFSYVAATATDKSRDDTMSISSMRSRMSVVSSSFSSSLSWFGTASSRPDPSRDVKYIYSCFTKIPSLRLGPIPARKLIQDFEDCPGQSAVPLDVFKNLQMLELDDVDPRTLLGWDRVCIQLRSLTCKKSNIEDLTVLLVDLVLLDAKRRRGEKVDMGRLRRAPPTDAGDNHSASNTDVEEDVTQAAAAAPKETIPTLPQDLPSLAWHFLRYLNLSSNNLTFIPAEPLLCLSGLTNLDLSSNLLNVVPPALSQLPALTSLNISDNLIDSVLGIYDALPAIRVLNLAKNRLESLCGVERLYTLQRIDLRGNAIYEAGEVGRLAPLAGIAEVWVKENPLEEELLDYRVECFAEFAQEGRSVLLDGEAAGFFERQRVAERVPNAAKLFSQADARESRLDTEAASGATRAGKKVAKEEVGEENEAQLAKDVATSSRTTTVVRNVRHRAPPRSAKEDNARDRGSELLQPGGEAGASDARSQSPSRNRDGARAQSGGVANNSAQQVNAKRRNQRVVELDTSPQKPRQRTLTESDRIKQAALAGNSSAAMESPEALTSQVRDGGSAQADGGGQQSPTRPAQKGKAGADVYAGAHGTMLFALPPGLTSPEKEGATRAGQVRTFTSRRNPMDSSTLGRKTAARPLASDLFATSSNAATAPTTAKNEEAGKAVEAAQPDVQPAVLARQRIARPRTGSAAALARRSRVTTSLYDPDLATPETSAATLGGVMEEEASQPATSTQTESASSNNTRSDAFRRRIEALKSEVGDDWLRLLARGGVEGDRNSVLLLEADPPAQKPTVKERKATRRVS